MSNQSSESQDPTGRGRQLLRAVNERLRVYETYQSVLQQANIPTRPRGYVTDVLRRSGIVAGSVFTGLWLAWIGFPQAAVWPSDRFLRLGGLFVGVSAAIGATHSVLRLAYPFVVQRRRRRRINAALPHAVIGINALVQGQVRPVEALRMLSRHPDAYGGVTEEVIRIIADVDQLGADLPAALRRAEQTSPSDQLTAFFRNLRSAIQSHGRPQQFLQQASTQQIDTMQATESDRIDTLTALVESYLVFGFLGPIILITTLITFGLTDVNTTPYVYATTYLIVPVIGIGFLLLVVYFTSAPVSGGRYPPDQRDESGSHGYWRHQRRLSMWAAVRNPFEAISNDPRRTLLITVPLAGMLAGGAVLTGHVQPTRAAITTQPVATTTWLVTLPGAIIAGGFAVGYRRQERRRTRVHNHIGAALKSLADANATGLSLAAGAAQYGNQSDSPVADSFKSVATNIELTADVTGAFQRFGSQVGSLRVTRTLALLTEANKAADDLAPVLRRLATYLEHRKTLDAERAETMQPYLFLLTAGVLIYLGIAVVLVVILIPALPDPDALGTETVPIPPELVRMALYHSSLLQSVFAGLIIGRLQANNASRGVLYMLVFATATTGAFVFI